MRTVPRRILEQLFGKRGLEWYDYSRGVDKRAIRASLIPKTISRETSFNADSTDRKFLMGTLYYLLERVCLELRRRALQTRRLTVKIQYVDYQMIDQAVSLDYPGDCEMEMFPQAARLLTNFTAARWESAMWGWRPPGSARRLNRRICSAAIWNASAISTRAWIGCAIILGITRYSTVKRCL
jgi:nucleotidyltransferase/DNA polymerase involved in DNA repair